MNGQLMSLKNLVEREANLKAMYGHLDVVKYLVDGVNKGHASHVFLVEQGANLHARDEDALRLADKYGHLDVVKYLVEQGADICNLIKQLSNI